MYPTTATVMERLYEYIEEDKNYYSRLNKHMRIPIDTCYKGLSVFDWFKNNLTRTDLNNMLDFCSLAAALGFNGYVCFKVGASGCANGMWAHKELSTDGFSPKGDFIYRSFTPDETYYAIKDGGTIYPEEPYNAWKNKTDLMNYVTSKKVVI